MKGLEISEVKLSELERTWRIDSQFYSRSNISVAEKLNELDAKPLTNFASVSDGNHMSISDKFIDDGEIPYYRGQDIYNFFIEQSKKPIRIDRSTYLSKQMERSHLNKGDVLMSIVGAIIGNLSLVTTKTDASCSCKLAILRPYSIQAELLAIFLKSTYGQVQIQKFKRGAAQTGLILEDFDQLKIPKFSDLFQEGIKSIVKLSFTSTKRSTELYSDAEDTLLNEVKFHAYEPNSKTINIKNMSDSFTRSGRLDAEYYQPKYEEMVNRISAQPHARLTDLVTIQKSIEPGSDAYTDDDGLPFLRVADYDKLGISTPQKRLNSIFSNEHFEKLEALKPKKGTILFSKDGSVGEAFCLREDADFITSGAILHLSIRNKQKILPEYLTLALNSILVRTQAERDAGGSIILHWRVDEIKNVLIPLVDITTQQKISSLVQKSFSFKSESERLLEVAKRAVEIAIEQDEAAGLAYIQEQTKGYAL